MLKLKCKSQILIIIVLMLNIVVVNAAIRETESTIENNDKTEYGTITSQNEEYLSNHKNNKDQPSDRVEKYQPDRLDKRDINIRISEKNNKANIRLDGNGEPIVFDFDVLKLQIDNLQTIQPNIIIYDAPGTVIENLRLTGENITLIDSPNSIIRNNTVENVVESNPSSVAYGIFVATSSNTLIINNTINNIKDDKSASDAFAAGIIVGMNCDNMTIESNIISNINATHSGAGPAIAMGIFLSTNYNATITQNTIMNITSHTINSAKSYGIQVIAENTLVDQITISDNAVTEVYAYATSTEIRMIYVDGNDINKIDIYNNVLTNNLSVFIDTVYVILIQDDAYSVNNTKIIDNQISLNSIATTKYIIYCSTGIGINTTISDNIQLSTTKSLQLSYAIFWAGKLQNFYVARNHFEGNAVNSTTGDATTYGMFIDTIGNVDNLTIIENTFADNSAVTTTGNAASYVFYLNGISFSNVSITNNDVYNSSAIAPNDASSDVISVNGDVSNFEIHGNYWNDVSASAAGDLAFSSMFYVWGTSTDLSISKNTFVDISTTNTVSDAIAYGIFFDGPVNNGVIFDNIIINSSVNSASYAEQWSFRTNSPVIQGLHIFNNTFIDSSVTATTGKIRTFYLDGSDFNNITIFQNKFMDSSITGNSVYSQSLWVFGTTTANVSIYNNIFSDSHVSSGSGNNCESYSLLLSPTTSLSNVTIFNNLFSNSSATASGNGCYSVSMYIDSISISRIGIYGNTFTDSSLSGGWVNEIYASSFDFFGSVSDTYIFNNTFVDSSATSTGLGQGVIIYGMFISGQNENVTIIDNYFARMIAFGDGFVNTYGIYVISGTNTTIQGNTFGNITASSTNDDTIVHGLYMSDSVNTTVEYNTFEYVSSSAPNNNSYVYGYYLGGSANVTLDYNPLLDISVGTKFYEIYLHTTYNVTIGLEEGLGMNVTWSDPLVPPPNGVSTYNYYVFRDNEIESQGEWDKTNFTLATKNLAGGYYNYTIMINGTGFSLIETIWITVGDTKAPMLVDSQDNTYEQGDTNNEISWTFEDLYPGTYSIIHPDGTEIVSDQVWTSGNPIVWNVDGLTAGTYIYRIEITDDSGNSVIVTISVIVTDTTDPQVTSPSDFTHEQGTTGVVEWNATDYNPSTYVLYQNGTETNPTLWTSAVPVSVDISQLTPGNYNFTIIFVDEFGNSFTDTVMVTVEDTTAPTVSSPADISYQEGETGNILIWTVTDMNNGTFVAYLNNTQISEATIWLSGDQIQLNVDDLGEGVHTITIEFTDEYGNLATDTVVIIVTASTTPIETDEPSDDGLSTGVIVVIVIGTLSALSGGGFIIFRRLKK